MRHIAAKLLLKPGHRVLDIGSGWGGLAIYLARELRVDVTGITLSSNQLQASRARAAEAGLAGRALLPARLSLLYSVRRIAYVRRAQHRRARS